MTAAEDIKKLTENIVIFKDVHLEAIIGEPAADTHKILNGFSTDRKRMAAQHGQGT